MEQKYNLVVGLGNPGGEYQNTYHNIGYLALDILAEKLAKRLGEPVGAWKTKSTKQFSLMKFPGLVLARPTSFMNESGVGVKNALAYTNKEPENLLVIHDDMDLEVGDIRVEFSRGAAGHHGVESIINALETNNFWRMRVGIRGPQQKTKAEEKVLRSIGEKDRQKIYSALESAMEKVIEKI